MQKSVLQSSLLITCGCRGRVGIGNSKCSIRLLRCRELGRESLSWLPPTRCSRQPPPSAYGGNFKRSLHLVFELDTLPSGRTYRLAAVTSGIETTPHRIKRSKHTMATSLVVPLAYITVLVTGLAIFSRVYRRRKAGEWWFGVCDCSQRSISSVDTDSFSDTSVLTILLVFSREDDMGSLVPDPPRSRHLHLPAILFIGEPRPRLVAQIRTPGQSHGRREAYLEIEG